ncbi:helix-turn-helix transcriptional regulator [Spiractinospora alimapuensis]|uniref:helix-turn-helix domain-containing protein n=1 Tax=Spiractinospora alimapuensis TaxID=2820884 RepID=UPI001F45F866|nr:helix-turn-helix transcriptional regulator [Spiractinospora alimapuensis]QVQ52157.1 helix-turn-helix transcriptional regulator [Spiractinospora alimapuensis]
MDHDSTVSDRLVQLRRRRGMSQEDLAEAADLSVGVVRKLEQGGTARIETYHRLGRALGVRTVWFMTPESPAPRVDDHRDTVLADIRSAVNPPAGIHGRIYPDDDVPPNLALLGRAVEAVASHYQADRYDDVARLSPALVRSAHMHVAALQGQERERAVRLRADALQLTGRYCIQIREHDLGIIALRDALTDALAVGDQGLAAAAIGQQGWTLLRQARFDEVEQLCVDTADALEPEKLTKADHGQIAAWGYILMRAAASAARNNRPDEARQYQAFARSAAEVVGEEIDTAGHMKFGPATVAMNGMQNELIADHPDRALELSEQIRANQAAATPNTQQRYALDKASAHLKLRNVEKTTQIMLALKAKAPVWLRNQTTARHLAEDLLEQAKRMPSSDHREIADFLGLAV